MKKITKKFKKGLALLLIVLILVSTLKFLVFKPKVVFADSTLGLNEGYGTTVKDENGTLTGTITNAVWKQEDLCKVGKCLYFDGTGDLINFGNDSDVNFTTGSFTITGWFRTPDITSGQRTIIAKHNATAGGYKVYIDSNGYLIFGIDPDLTWSPSDSVSSSTTTVDDNKWHHFVAVKNGTTSISLYLDTNLMQTDSSITASSLTNSDTFYVGIDGNGSSNGFSGFLDEIKVYSTGARTEAEIKADYLAETQSRGVSTSFGPDQSYLSSGLLGYWMLDNTSDVSGNGITLTNNGTTTFVGGKFGNGSEHVPASLQYLSTATTITSVKSVSFWTNPDATTNYYISLTSGAYITSSSGTLSATGFTNPKIYVNGVETSTIIANSWQLVTVTTDTAIDANQFYVGRQGSSYYDGTLDEVRIYNRVLSPTEVAKLYNWAPGPVSYWKMDENTGQSLNTIAGSAGTLGIDSSIASDDPNWTSGKFGQALLFDGIDDIVRNDDNDIYSFGNSTTDSAFSLEAWVYATNGISRYVAYKASEWYLRLGTDGRLICEQEDISVAGTIGRSWSPTFPTNGWHYVACTYDGSGVSSGTKIYVDGIRVDDVNETSGSYVAMENSTNSVRFGGISFFQGKIDDVKIYNYARNPAQIIEDMNGGHPAPGSPVGSSVVYWKFDEGYGTTANDNSLNANNLTLSTASWTNGGKFGKAFNGLTNVRASRADDADLDFSASEDLSFSIWFKSDSATNPSANEYLLEKGGNITTDAIGYAVYTSSASDGLICFGIDDDVVTFPEDEVCSSSDLYDNTWHHIIVTKTGTSRLDLYVDGKTNGTPDTSISATGTLANSATFYLGDTNGTDGTDEFLGDLDEIKVFRSALSADSVKVLYNQSAGQQLGATSTDSTGTATWSAENEYCPPGQGSTCTPPIGHWRLDENTGTSTAYDISTNGNDATLSAGGGTSTIVSDTFTETSDTAVTSHTPDTGTSYTSVQNSVICTEPSGAATAPVINATSDIVKPCLAAGGTDVGQWVTSQSAPTSTVQSISITISTVDTGSATRPVGIFGRRTDNDNAYIAIIRPTAHASNSLELFVISGGTATSLGSYDEALAANGIVKLEITDATKKVYYDGVERISSADNTLTSAGTWGLGFGRWRNAADSSTLIAGNVNGSSTAFRLDDFLATETTTGSTPQWATGKFGSALSFGGSNAYVSRADDSDFDFADDADMTLMTWFKHTTASAQEIIMSKYNEAGYKIIMESDGDITCALDYDSTWTPTDSATSTAAIYDDNAWHHIACVKSGATSLSLYIDGVLIATDSSLTVTNTLTNSDPIYFGVDADAASNDFTGSLDNIKIYTTARTPAQIAWEYNRGAPIGWWKLDENTGTIANDSMGNSTAGTLTNSPTWATGKFNQAISFTGTNQHVLIADDPDFDFADDEDLTLTTWFKHSAASAQEIIMSKYNEAGYKIIMESDGDITCALDYDSTWSPTDSATSTLATYDDGNWHHITCVKTGATSLNLYIDGVLITTDSSITATNTLTNTDPIYLGIDADGTTLDFTGSLDDVRIYRYPLTTQQIKTVMNNASAVRY